jgi:hypothetical protein
MWLERAAEFEARLSNGRVIGQPTGLCNLRFVKTGGGGCSIDCRTRAVGRVCCEATATTKARGAGVAAEDVTALSSR